MVDILEPFPAETTPAASFSLTHIYGTTASFAAPDPA